MLCGIFSVLKKKEEEEEKEGVVYAFKQGDIDQ